ncbi:aldehyde dehydrogenase family protein [Alkalihalobacterium bogoriense]|uniref:aldehyde dehydrogenase family protein n=1 Tax=Alkalihalobacterium bogoriense TaxID=246272 RepID=UPI00047B3DFB|nr:aldehyde dehydrogenase family protein [Alkalihalobacterium bogoriense]
MKQEIQPLYIGGEWTKKTNTYPVYSPVDHSLLTNVSAADEEDVIRAIESAERGFSELKQKSSLERSQILERVSSLLETDKEKWSNIICIEAGKPIRDARAELERTITTYKLAAEEAKRIHGDMIPMDAVAGGANRIGFTAKEPLGVVCAITPFNFPFNLVAHKVGPAIAAGNAIVLKPAEQTPLSAIKLTELLLEAGLPKEAIQLVTGSGKQLSKPMLEHNLVKKISFTGSVPVGKEIKAKAGLKKTTLELGSNSAVIIERDTNIEKVAKRCVRAAFAYSGQVCISLQRIYVHHTLFEQFVDFFAMETKKLKQGLPQKETTDIGPMISPQAFARVDKWVKEAKADGAVVVTGGKGANNIYEPTVLIQVNPKAKVSCEEVFGPVVSIYSYENLQEAIASVNDSSFGLHTGIFIKDITKAFQAAKAIQSGGVLINEVPTFRLDHFPYGGVKESGYGREGVKYAVEEMLETKFYMINVNEEE